MSFRSKLHIKYWVVLSDLSAVIYHKTDETKAVKILKENSFRLSTWLGTASDRPKGVEQLWFFSTSTRPGAYRKGSSGVVFVLDGAKLNKKYAGSPFDYWGEEWQKAAKNNGHGDDYDEAEERIFSDTPTIPEASDYIKEIHADWWMPDNEYKAHAYKRHRELTKLAKQHGIPLYWYGAAKQLDTLPKGEAKKFSDFPAGPSMTSEQLEQETKWGRISDYRVKKWNALLSIQPAKSIKDIPKNVREYLSGWGDGHLGFEADIHNATKGMKDDEMRFIYKLDTQMKREKTKSFKDFYWKMMENLRALERQETALLPRESVRYGAGT
jgi:hypothetical protein